MSHGNSGTGRDTPLKGCPYVPMPRIEIMREPKTKAEKIAYLKNWMAGHKMTVTHDPLVPEWFAMRVLRLRDDDFVRIVLMDDCPVRPIHKAGARFYRLEDIAEFLEFPE